MRGGEEGGRAGGGGGGGGGGGAGGGGGRGGEGARRERGHADVGSSGAESSGRRASAPDQCEEALLPGLHALLAALLHEASVERITLELQRDVYAIRHLRELAHGFVERIRLFAAGEQLAVDCTDDIALADHAGGRGVRAGVHLRYLDHTLAPLREVDLRIDADLPVALLQGDLADPVELHEPLFVLLQLRLLHVEPHPADRPHDLKRVVVTGLDDLQRHSACAHHAARQRARMQSGLAGTPPRAVGS